MDKVCWRSLAGAWEMRQCLYSRKESIDIVLLFPDVFYSEM